MKNKVLSAFLAVIMLIGMIPISFVSAEGQQARPAFIVSDAVVYLGDETASFTLSVENNPGIFSVLGYIGYDENASLASFEFGDVFSEEEFQLGNPIDSELRHDIAASESAKIEKIYNENNAKTDGILATNVYAESLAIENNTENGVLLSFSLNITNLEAGEHHVTFYYDRNSVINSDGENVDFDMVHGTLTVLPCGHELTKGETVTPDCTNGGYTFYRCDECGVTVKMDRTFPLGHDFEAQSVVAPTCKEKGYTNFLCKMCGEESVGDYVNKLRHNYVDTVIPPTCTEAERIVSTCTECDYYDEYDGFEDALGHDIKAEIKNPTGSEDGFIRTYCTRCDYEETEVLPKRPASPPPSDDGGVNDDIAAGGAPSNKPNYNWDAAPPPTTDQNDTIVDTDTADTEAAPEADNSESTNHQTGDSLAFFVLTAMGALLCAAGVTVFGRKKLFVR